MEIITRKCKTIELGKFYQTDNIIQTSCTAYDETGELIFSFMKNVLPAEVYNFDEKIVKVSKSESENRGNAAGKVTIEGLAKGKEHWKRFPAELCDKHGNPLTKESSSSFFKYHDGVISKRARSNTVNSVAIGGFDKSPQHPCRLTFYTKKLIEEYPTVFPICEKICEIYHKEFPEYYNRQLDAYRDCPCDFVIPNSVFSTITLNHDFRTACHEDKGDFKKGLTCFAVKKCGEYTGGELCFPEYNLGVNVEEGDLLIFNPHIAHCNNDLNGQGRMSMVFYLREKMSRCDTSYKD